MIKASVLVPADMDAVQRDHRLATIHADHGLVGKGRNGVRLCGEGERMTRQIQMIVARDEVLQERMARLVVRGEEVLGEDVATHAVHARTGFHEGDAGVSAGKLRGVRATEQGGVTVHVSGVRKEAMRRTTRAAGAAGRSGRATGPFDDLQHAAIHRGRAERARDSGVALFGDEVGAGRTDVDRVITRGASLGDRATLAKSERIVAAADDDLARTRDVDIVAAVAGKYGAVAKNGDVDLPATGNTDGGAQWISPLIRTRALQAGLFIV
jgi:hypothetical protein